VKTHKKFLFLAANLAIGLGIVEGAARLLAPAPLEWREHPARLLRPDAERGWALRANADDWTVDKPSRINSDGFRDREFATGRSRGTRRIVCVGDSYTYGWGVELDDSYPKQLERSLSEKHPTEALNMGVFGYNAAQARVTLEEQGLKYRPDIVIYSFYWDDLLPVRPGPVVIADEESGIRSTLRHSRALFVTVSGARSLLGALSPSRSRFHRCWEALLRGDDESIGDLWETEASEIRRMRDSAAAHGAKLFVIVWPLEPQVLVGVSTCRFQEKARRVCDELGVPSVSLLEPLREVACSGESPYLPYEKHPTPEGYRRAVEKMAQALREQGLVE
jgi:lysophospholipase L1-like esterase